MLKDMTGPKSGFFLSESQVDWVERQEVTDLFIVRPRFRVNGREHLKVTANNMRIDALYSPDDVLVAYYYPSTTPGDDLGDFLVISAHNEVSEAQFMCSVLEQLIQSNNKKLRSVVAGLLKD